MFGGGEGGGKNNTAIKAETDSVFGSSFTFASIKYMYKIYLIHFSQQRIF
jgi:hypothetical protein